MKRPQSGTSIAVLLGATLLGLFALISLDVVNDGLVAGADPWTRSLVNSWRSPGLTTLLKALSTAFDSDVVPWVVAVIGAALLAARLRLESVLVVGAMLVELALQLTTKTAFGRVRPPAASALIELPGSLSYPSGHALASTVLLGLLAFIACSRPLSWKLKWAAVGASAVLALSVGFSRVYLGVHWASDVYGGWLLGGAWLNFACGGYLVARAKLAERGVAQKLSGDPRP